MKTFKTVLENQDTYSIDALITLIEEIMIGEIAEIQEKASLEAFTAMIAYHVIGSWKSGGIAIGVISNSMQKVPFIPDVMRTLKLEKVAEGFESLLTLFPKDTVFEDTQDFCDIINLLEGHPKAIENQTILATYSPAMMKKIHKEYVTAIGKLEDIVEPMWGYDAGEYEGWDVVINYINQNINANIWRVD